MQTNCSFKWIHSRYTLEYWKTDFSMNCTSLNRYIINLSCLKGFFSWRILRQDQPWFYSSVKRLVLYSKIIKKTTFLKKKSGNEVFHSVDRIKGAKIFFFFFFLIFSSCDHNKQSLVSCDLVHSFIERKVRNIHRWKQLNDID